MGRRRMPEGYVVVLAQNVATTAATGSYSFKLDSDYWFFLEAVLGKWAAPAVPSVPSLQILRTLGGRSYMTPPVDFRLVGSPGEAPPAGARLSRVVGLGMYFPPGSALQMEISGYVQGDPATIELAALGRYVLEGPQDG